MIGFLIIFGFGFLVGMMYQGSHLKKKMCESCKKEIFDER
jgi:hypothetical protein